MKRLLAKKFGVMAAVILILAMICSCGTPVVSDKKGSSNDKTIEPVKQPGSKVIDKSQVIGSIDLSEFKDTESLFDRKTLVTSKLGEDLETNYDIKGKCDLDGDGKQDTISCLIKGAYGEGGDSTISVNGKVCVAQFENPEPGKVYIIDLDSRDNYKEIAVYDNGPSDDPSFTYFRYIKGNVINLGTVAPGLADGKGRLIGWYSLAGFIKPDICSGWYELHNNKVIFKENDVTGAFGKEYTVSEDREAFFKEFKEIPVVFEPDYSIPQIKLKKGDNITIKGAKLEPEFDNQLLWYGVKLSNGKTGVLYFYLGD